MKKEKELIYFLYVEVVRKVLYQVLTYLRQPPSYNRVRIDSYKNQQSFREKTKISEISLISCERG